jgi:hypothetical protein
MMKGIIMNTFIRKLRVYLGNLRASDPEVSDFAQGVEEGMNDNPAFPDPPLPLTPPVPPDPAAPTDLQTLRLAFTAARVAAANGGTQLTAIKDQKRELLTEALHALAMYVQTVARTNLVVLLSSGFEACSTNRAQVPLQKPAIMALVNETTGHLLLRGQPVLNARSYQAQTSTDDGKTWTDMGDFTGARRIVLQPVTPGTVYTVHFRAVGGSTKYSEWSDPSSHIAT